jgi:predicted nucleic acid-binding protein
MDSLIFVDASAFFALYKKDDPRHDKAVKIARMIDSGPIKKVTSNLMISETLTLISMRVGKAKAIETGKTFQEIDIMVHFIDQIFHQKAWKIFKSIKDKDVSFADCTSFAVMEALGIKTAFSFDEDFKRYGFEAIEV